MLVYQRIDELLKSTGIKNSTIAKAINSSPGTVGNYRNGKTDPSIFFYEWLFKEFDKLNGQWLFLGLEPKFLDFKKISESENTKAIAALRERLEKQEAKNEELGKKLEEVILHIEQTEKLMEKFINSIE